jgi:hypothetical protein
MGITLLSTVVAPSFTDGTLILIPVKEREELKKALGNVGKNFCGHPVTDRVLRELCPTLPTPEKGFWDGTTTGLAIRPKGGVRGAQASGDTIVTLADLEAVLVIWEPEPEPRFCSICGKALDDDEDKVCMSCQAKVAYKACLDCARECGIDRESLAGHCEECQEEIKVSPACRACAYSAGVYGASLKCSSCASR